MEKIKFKLDSEPICEVKHPDVSYEMYRKLECENAALKDAIVRLTLKVMGLERQLHPDVW